MLLVVSELITTTITSSRVIPILSMLELILFIILFQYMFSRYLAAKVLFLFDICKFVVEIWKIE